LVEASPNTATESAYLGPIVGRDLPVDGLLRAISFIFAKHHL
jgi:hypothetical protein